MENSNLRLRLHSGIERNGPLMEVRFTNFARNQKLHIGFFFERLVYRTKRYSKHKILFVYKYKP